MYLLAPRNALHDAGVDLTKLQGLKYVDNVLKLKFLIPTIAVTEFLVLWF